MAILVIAEHDHHSLNDATLNAVAAAVRIAATLDSSSIDLLVAGSDVAGVAAQAASVEGVARVLLADAPHYAAQGAENLAALIVSLSAGYSHILAAATSNGKNILPRVAALLDVAQISDVQAVHAADRFDRPIYAGNVITTLVSDDALKVITVRVTAFDGVGKGGNASIETIAAGPDLGQSRLVGRELVKSARPELAGAKIVVSGGRGLGNGDQYRQLLEPLADRLGAALGASRAAVDAGFVPNTYQVGQTGQIVAPQLYIAIGISGAIQHLAGMKDSKVIVAINKDPEAPIFQVADYGLVADLFQAVPDLVTALG